MIDKKENLSKIDDTDILGEGKNGLIHPGKFFFQQGTKECDVAVKTFPSLNIGKALNEVINNARIFKKHPNLVSLRAV